jgi:hypothetical protein
MLSGASRLRRLMRKPFGGSHSAVSLYETSGRSEVMLGFATIYVEILISGCVIFYIPECLQADNLKLYKSHLKLINEWLLLFRFLVWKD